METLGPYWDHGGPFGSREDSGGFIASNEELGAMQSHPTVKKKNCEITLCVCVCVLSHVQLFVTPQTVAYQAPLSMGFSRQEYWSGLPFPSPEDLPDPGIKPASLVSPALAGRFFTTGTTWEALTLAKGKCEG